MKKILRLFIFILSFTALFCTTTPAETYSDEFLPTDTIEYTLQEKDNLSAVLFIDEDGLYNLKITAMSGSLSTPKIAIKISDGNDEIYRFETKHPFLEDGSFDSERFQFSAGLTEGIYEVEIENLTLFSDVSFKIETSFTAQENIETAKNNSFENATSAQLRTKYYGGVVMSDETDYYSFEMPYDGYAYIQMYSPDIKLFYLYDENKNEIGVIEIKISDPEKVYELRTGLPQGKYYIAIRPEENFSSPLYSIEVITAKGEHFEREYNNKKEFAHPIESGKEYQGNLFGIYDTDVYSFTLTKDSSIKIDFTDTIVSSDGHYSINVSDGENILYSVEECGRKTIPLNLSAGTYYFTVSSLGYHRFTNMAYKLKLTSNTPIAICPPEDDAGAEEAPPMQQQVLQFSDVKDSKWYAKDLLEAKQQGLIEGLDGNKYNPEGNVTLAQAITMATRLHSQRNSIQVDFGNSDGKWYDAYVKYAISNGLIKSDDFDTYENFATRAEVAYIFSNVFEEVESDINISIPDVDQSTPFHESIYKLYNLEILKGDDDKGTFYPQRQLTRAEAAVILLRIHKS